MKPRKTAQDWLCLLLLTAAAILVHGYHAGVEDMAIYEPAIEKLLHPKLFPYDANFFLLHLRWTLFPPAVAGFVRLTHLPLDVVIFIWHVASIFLLLFGCFEVSRRCFREPAAQWSSVAMVAALLTMPVAGTRLFIADQYLDPRAISTAALLFALAAVLDRRLMAFLWVAVSALFHPTMTLYGAFHLVFQAWGGPAAQLSSFLPLPIPGGAPNPVWREVMQNRSFLFPLRWQWYEWFGTVAPIALLFYFARLGRRRDMATMARVSQRLAVAAIVGVLGSVSLSLFPQTEILMRIEPMRVLHLVYLLFVLFLGGLLGSWLLRDRPLRWLILFLPICAAMFFSQVSEFPASPHIEWPGCGPANAWVEAFDWVRQNTPRNALFALDPQYVERPGEDFHGFRAFAERSVLADSIKDTGVVALFPSLAYEWKQQVTAQENWRHFRLADFERLKKIYGVTWVVLQQPGVRGLACPYQNRAVLVCRVP